MLRDLVPLSSRVEIEHYVIWNWKISEIDKDVGIQRSRFQIRNRYSNINSQLDATITNFIDNYNQLNMFRAIISPIIRINRLFLQLVL